MGSAVETPARAADCWDLLLQAVDLRPDHRAIVAGERTLAYHDLHRETLAIVAGLAEAGVTPGDVVLIVLGNVPEFVSTFLAAQFLRAVAAPINPAWTHEETAVYAKHVGATHAVIADGEAARSLESLGIRVTLAQGPEMSLATWRARGEVDFPRPSECDTDAPALMQPSSGSMGRPKIAVRTGANLVSEAANLARTAGLDADDRFLAIVPLYHCHGLGNCLQASLHVGGTLVLADRFDPHSAVRLIADEGITVFPGVPFMFGIMAEGSATADLSRMKLCFSAGGPLPEATYRAFKEKFRVPVRQLYGCTEAGSVTINTSDDADSSCETVGRAIDGVDLRVVDDSMHELPAGEVGEVVFAGPALMSGYLDDDSDSPFRDGYFRSGDLGVMDAARMLTIKGRRKVFIDVGGQKVDPTEIEEVIRKMPEVADVVVVGAPTRFGDEIVRAVVVARTAIEPWQIIEHCQSALSSYKCPKAVDFRSAIPRSPLGKVLRGKL